MDSIQKMEMNNERVLSAAENNKSTFISFSVFYSRSDYGFNFQCNGGKSRKLLIFTLAGDFVHLVSTRSDPFCPQTCLNSLWHRFKKVLETFLRDFDPC